MCGDNGGAADSHILHIVCRGAEKTKKAIYVIFWQVCLNALTIMK